MTWALTRYWDQLEADWQRFYSTHLPQAVRDGLTVRRCRALLQNLPVDSAFMRAVAADHVAEQAAAGKYRPDPNVKTLTVAELAARTNT